jgi:hypothetical protein
MRVNREALLSDLEHIVHRFNRSGDETMWYRATTLKW